MNAVTYYMGGLSPQQPEVAINSMMTCLLIDPKAATVLASVVLTTYFVNGVSWLLETTPMAVGGTQAKEQPMDSRQLGVEENAVSAPEASNAPERNNLPRP